MSKSISKSTPLSVPALNAVTESVRRGESLETAELLEALELAERRLRAARSEADSLRSRVSQLQDLLRTDPVTGLGNRRAFEERLDNALAAATRHGEQGAIVFIDCDDFKAVNDRFGHSVGDKVLRKIAQFLTNRVRQNDFVGRYGGDEFVVLLEQCELDIARDRMRTLEADLRNTSVIVEGHRISLHASFGVTSFGPNTSASRILRAADAAMYERKRESRELLVANGDTAQSATA